MLRRFLRGFAGGGRCSPDTRSTYRRALGLGLEPLEKRRLLTADSCSVIAPLDDGLRDSETAVADKLVIDMVQPLFEVQLGAADGITDGSVQQSNVALQKFDGNRWADLTGGGDDYSYQYDSTADVITLTCTNEDDGELFRNGQYRIVVDAVTSAAGTPQPIGQQVFYVEITGDDSNTFSIAVLPDTQKYAEVDQDPGGDLIAVYQAQTQWIADKVHDENIVLATHLGDIVENTTCEVAFEPDPADVEAEWKAAETAMETLDELDQTGSGLNFADGLLPYGVCMGNHDDGDGSPEDPAHDTQYYEKYYGSSRFQQWPGRQDWYGGTPADPGTHEDANDLYHYQVISACGIELLHFSVPYATNDNAISDGIAWIKEVIDHADHRQMPVVLSTHSYLGVNGRRSGQGTTLFDDLVEERPQIFMVLSGHSPGTARKTALNKAGGAVYELLVDYQSGPNGGDGYLSLMKFLPDEDRIQVRGYSPYQDAHLADAGSRFDLEVDFAGRFQSYDLPTAGMVAPNDNGPGDRDAVVGTVLVGASQAGFVIQLGDYDTDTKTFDDIKDSSANNSSVVSMKKNGGYVYYDFSYNGDKNQITLGPYGDSFGNGTYEITLNGGTAKITDDDTPANQLPTTTLTVIIDETTLIDKGSAWKYYDSGSQPGGQASEWYEAGFDDASWDSGPAELGRNEGDERTVISNATTTYFRHTFDVADKDQIDWMVLSLLRDDGAVVYLNGIEVVRSNMYPGSVDYNTLAVRNVSGSAEQTFYAYDLYDHLDDLDDGSNLLAVEIHRYGSSSDISFDLELSMGTTLVTEIQIDKGSQWSYFVDAEAPDPDGQNREWNEQGFQHSWPSGLAELGYGDTQKKDVGYVDTDPVEEGDQRNITTYFLHTFDTGAREFRDLQLSLLRDDGAVVYLNGEEVARSNMNSGEVDHDTPAKTDVEGDGPESTFHNIDLDDYAYLLEETGNVMAVEIHQYNEDSDDISFELELTSQARITQQRQRRVVWQALVDAQQHDWYYSDAGIGSQLGVAWREPGFDHSGWDDGQAEFGYDSSNPPTYGEGDENTIVGWGPNASQKYITTYFRRDFEVPDAGKVHTLMVGLLRDDGAVVYLNGTEIARENMPSDRHGNVDFAAIDYETVASTNVEDDDTFYEFEVDPRALQCLVDGTNVLAVEIHQRSQTNDDISFDVKLIAETTTVAHGFNSSSGTFSVGGTPFADTIEISGDDSTPYKKVTVNGQAVSHPTVYAKDVKYIVVGGYHGDDIIDLSGVTTGNGYTDPDLPGDGLPWHNRIGVDGGQGEDLIIGSPFGDMIFGDNGDYGTAPGDDDTIYGGDANDWLEGEQGDDTLDGGLGDDWSYGGPGDDTYTFSGDSDLGADALYEGGGNDTWDFSNFQFAVSVDLSLSGGLIAEDGLYLSTLEAGCIENVIGSPLDDDIQGSSADNCLIGGGGDDSIVAEGGDDTLEGGTGDDVLNGGSDNDTYRFSGSQDLGEDVISDVSGSADALDFAELGFAVDVNIGQPGKQTVAEDTQQQDMLALTYAHLVERVFGSPQKDTIWGNTQGNHLHGNGDRDTIYGVDGEAAYGDYLYGGAGNDLLHGDGSGDGYGGGDYIEGGTGADEIYGHEGNDQIYGDQGDDTVDAGDGQDTVYGYAGDDDIEGGLDDENGYGDHLYGGVGDDEIHGDLGDGFGFGYGGGDYIDGGSGADELYGEDGDDTLIGGTGNDTLDGGERYDVYRYGGYADQGDDTIDESEDYGGTADVLDFTNFAYGIHLDIGSIAEQTVAQVAESRVMLYLTLDEDGIIERAYGTQYDDSIAGNARDNRICGYAGDDTLAVGASGADSLFGHAGADVFYLDDGTGDDYADGGVDSDTDTEDSDSGDTLIRFP